MKIWIQYGAFRLILTAAAVLVCDENVTALRAQAQVASPRRTERETEGPTASAEPAEQRSSMGASTGPQGATPGNSKLGRSAYGGSFRGTFAYGPEVGYDYGQVDDNGARTEDDKGARIRRSGKRPDPGDRDLLDAYRQGILYNDGSLGDYDDLDGYLEFHGRVGRQRYWRSEKFIPLRYDDFREYQLFRYELGSSP